jgi:hypothetical protein
MSFRSWLIVLCLGMALVMPMRVGAAETNPHITGIYSDLSYNDDDGVVGTEIFIVATVGEQGLRYAVFFQYWQSGTTFPVVVPAQVEGAFVSFEIPEPSMGAGLYKGRISVGGFDGTWRHPLANGSELEEPIYLKRTRSYWQ